MITKIRDMMKRKNGQKGFTLVELIVVMAILAVLAAIAVPKYTSILSASKTKADNATAAQIISAARIIEVDNNLAMNVVAASLPAAGGDWQYPATTGGTIYMNIPTKAQSIPTATAFTLTVVGSKYKVDAGAFTYTEQ
jgi:type IV pilus assembly protein PilA